jgi:hypothetical protein
VVAVDLERRVADLEPGLDQGLEVVQDAVVVGAGLGDDVRRECREAARDRPDVQVVHLLHPGVVGHRLADLARVAIARCDLHEDPKRLADEPP